MKKLQEILKNKKGESSSSPAILRNPKNLLKNPTAPEITNKKLSIVDD